MKNHGKMLPIIRLWWQFLRHDEPRPVEVRHPVRAGPHGVDLRDHVPVPLPTHQHMVPAPHRDWAWDGELLPVGQGFVGAPLPPGVYKVPYNFIFFSLPFFRS